MTLGKKIKKKNNFFFLLNNNNLIKIKIQKTNIQK
jgi:hypothetical protein